MTFARLVGEENAFGFPFSDTTTEAELPPLRRGEPGSSPRAVLEELVRPAVERGGCIVLFSGGRDSSAMLALATHVARKIGADDPVPVTVRHPKAPLSDEREWQQAVIDHLALARHHVLEFDGEQSYLGSAAQSGLARHGLVWPSALQTHEAIYRHLDPGPMITGEGGDLVVAGRRVTSVAAALRSRHARSAASALADAAVPGRMRRRRVESGAPSWRWLTPEGARRLRARLAAEKPEPLAWSRALPDLAGRRVARLGALNFVEAAKEFRLDVTNPFDEGAFIFALADVGGFRGIGDRTEVMRFLFSDLLPDAVLARTTKAAFNETRWRSGEREFARTWSGAGIDHDLVDAELLRAEWLSERPHPLASYAIQGAWLAENGLPWVPYGT